MNSVEQEHIEETFGDSSGRTMEDFFDYFVELTNHPKDEIKAKFKECYPDITDWSF